MADPTALEQDAIQFASRAVKCDQEGMTQTAVFYYTEAAQALLTAAMAGCRLENCVDRANQYIRRAEQLKAAPPALGFSVEMKSQLQLDLERAEFLVRHGLEEDGGDNEEEAIDLYSQAVELCIKLRQETNDKDLQAKITKLATQALDRAEELKKNRPTTSTKQAPVSPVPQPRVYRPLGDALLDDEGGRQRKAPPPAAAGAPRPSGHKGGGGSYTKEEIQVLKTTSFINSREYVPFMSVDMRERFAYPMPFNDKCGKLALSPQQMKRFARWVRPEQFLQEPKMIYAISSFSIRQTLISDCSFVASLAISAQYERRFRKKLITSIIYPQNRQGDPVYNPCGKYMVKLNLNGVPRKVVIDDMLPMSGDGELLCSHSSNRSELWVSLLEKAYMKVMGGYDFPGSNSNIDLHALTGWIPERISIREDKKEFDPNKEFYKVMDRFHKGHCLVTLATGPLSEGQADRAGLVPTHAYAMIDIREVKGQKLLQLKNPWSHLRWKGNFSELDIVHWTSEMKSLLNYDPKSAQMHDNGVFWIDYESLLKFFDVIYLNWDPDLFSHTTCMHHTWTAKQGPKKDVFNIGDNPQYRLHVNSPKGCALWILLTRHITDKDDFADNKEFITVLVYKSQGNRIFYPFDPPPYRDGVRINSPHYLVKMVEEKGSHTYTLVISQYEKNNTIHYTLRVYGSTEFSLTKISEPYNSNYEKQITGQWKGISAGGCGNYPETHKNNPVYQLKIDNNTTDNQIMIELRGPKQFSVGFEVLAVAENVPNSPTSFKKKSSGAFRPGFCVLELPNISGGLYNIIPCTFYPGKESAFFLNISSNVPISVGQLQ